MRFYGMALADAKKLPIRSFWKLNQMIDRVRAEELLDQLPVLASAFSTKEGLKSLIEGLERRIGSTIVVEQMKATQTDLDKLRQRFGVGA